MNVNTVLEHLGDVPLTLDVHVSCRSLSVGDLLALQPGAIIRTRCATGDNVDVFISGEHVAEGELIVIENVLAIRISEFTENK